MTMTLVVCTCIFVGYNTYCSLSKKVISNLVMANIDALARQEGSTTKTVKCCPFITSPTPNELKTFGPDAFDKVVGCSPCNSVVIASTYSGVTECSYE